MKVKKKLVIVHGKDLPGGCVVAASKLPKFDSLAAVINWYKFGVKLTSLDMLNILDLPLILSTCSL